VTDKEIANPALLLGQVPLFSVMGSRELAELGPVIKRKSLPRGRTVFREGDDSTGLYIILSGRTKVQRSDADGKEVILAMLGSGEYFGEMSLIDDMPRSATVVTLESCEFITISKDDFRMLLQSSNRLSMAIMRGLVQRLRAADSKIESLALLDVYGRVARVLMEFSEMENGERLVRDKLPRQDVAKMIGASREMVSRVMKDLENDGFFVVRPDGSYLLNELRAMRNQV